VTDEVFLVAARRLAQLVPQASLDQGSLYPPLEAVRAVSFEIGCAVAELVWKRGLAEEPEPADVRAFVGAHVYEPRYVPYLAP
jgi:malate dehydrogenase (oxaloacetate-decarboxylating)(NADP+)